MKTLKISKTLIIIGGVIELLIALMHFIWPLFMSKLSELNNVSEAIMEFIFLGTLAVGLCLIIFSFFSFYFSSTQQIKNKSTWIFSLSQSIMWLIRLFFELLFPVKIDLFGIQNPSKLIVIGTAVISLVFLLPVLLLKSSNNE